MENKEQIKIGSKAHQSVICSGCQKQVSAGQFFSYKDNKKQDIYFCSACCEGVAKAYSEEMANPNLAQAGLVGCLGAVVAGFLWYWIVQWTQREFGYFSIGVGFLIGYAVHWGSGMKRGPSLQMMSAVLTLITLYTANYFIAFQSIKRYIAAQHPVWLAGGEIAYISPFHPDVVRAIISPMGILIWGIGIYFAYQIPKSRSV
ncbi:MAG: hypothetical protein AABX37_01680 [Nanoarchaeota archaeon]